MTSKLAIANEYGNVDLTRCKLPKSYVHVQGPRLQPLCRKLKIKFCEAIVGFDGYGSYDNKRFSPIKDGVVVSVKSEAKLLAAIEERQARTATRPARPKKADKVLAAGLIPGSRTADWWYWGDIPLERAHWLTWQA